VREPLLPPEPTVECCWGTSPSVRRFATARTQPSRSGAT
jgi:hypothetical protein